MAWHVHNGVPEWQWCPPVGAHGLSCNACVWIVAGTEEDLDTY